VSVDDVYEGRVPTRSGRAARRGTGLGHDVAELRLGVLVAGELRVRAPKVDAVAVSAPAYPLAMSPADDDDDWVGEPPEGRYTRDRARPDFWANHWQQAVAGAVLGIAILVALLVILL